MAKSEWKVYNDNPPPLGVEVLAQHPKWVNEYNEDGIRVGFQNEQDAPDGYFISAAWNNTNDCWETCDLYKPLLWKPKN